MMTPSPFVTARRFVAPLTVAALVIAACGDKTAPCSVTSVAVSPQTSTIAQGTSASLNATAVSQNCNPVPAATWSSSANNIATVTPAGLVTGQTPGQALITATIGGVSGTAAVTIIPPPVASVTVTPGSGSVAAGSTIALTATTRDGQGNVLTGRTVNWTTSASGIATVSSAGVVLGVAAGTATITATSEGVSGSATITVTPAPVASVTVTLTSATMFPGATQVASAVLRDAGGQVLTGRSVTWLSTSPGVASIDFASGLIIAISAGGTTIMATSEGVSGSAVLTVSPVPVTSVTVTVPSATMPSGTSQQATAVLRGPSNEVLTGRTVTWASSNQGVAQVGASTGVITAVAPGAAAITATSEGVTGAVAITVVLPPPTLSTITPMVVDAVFATVPVTATGTNFVVGATTMSFTGTAISAPVVTVQTANTLSSSISIVGGLATTAAAVTVTTAGGTSNALAITAYSVGTAPLSFGTAHGGTGGAPFALACDLANEVATGLNVMSGANFDQIQVRCQPVTGAGRAFGALRTTATAGGVGGNAATLSCPANTVMTGISGRVGPGTTGVVDQIAVICTPIAGGANVTTASAGNVNPGSLAFTSSCPVGLAVTRVQGRSGTLVDQIQIVCR